jgi:Chaperone of endosialidase
MAANYDLPAVVEKRVRFFDGQFLQDQDFVDEQKYHLDRERRQLRLLHVAGIADGLAVAAGDPNKVTVAPGTAIDSDGRQLVLAQAATVDLPAEKFNDKQGVELYLSYRESAEDEQTEAGSRDFTRWLERPQLTAIAPGEAYAGATPPVLLARLALDGAGRVTVDDTVRLYAGLRLPGPGADPPTLRTAAGGPVGLTGSLSVDGDLRFTRTSTISAAGRLHISGDELLYLLNKNGVVVGKEWGGSGALTVQGDLQAGGSASVQGRLSVSGNVAAGTTSTGARLDVAGVADTAGQASLQLRSGNSAANSNSDQITLGYNNTAQYRHAIKSRHHSGQQAGNAIDFYVWNYSTQFGAADRAGGLHTMTLDGGNVGVGTTAPAARLSVVQAGASELAGTAHSAVLRTSAGALGAAAGSEVALSSTGLTVTNHMSFGVRAIRTAQGSNWYSTAIALGMDVDNTVRAGASLFLHANGNVGVGTTTPGAKLQVTGAGGGAVDLVVNGRLRSNNNDGGLWVAEDRFVGGHSTNQVGFWNNDAWRLTVANNGNVGIGVGTTAPAVRLQVSGGAAQFDGNQKILFTDQDTSNNLKLQLWTGYGLGINGGTLFYAANGRHSWRDNAGANERMALTTAADGGLIVTGKGTSSFAGNVGIGGTLSFTAASTISAAGRLHISGDEILYLLNKSGVTVGKEWGGTGSLTVQGDLQVGGDIRASNVFATGRFYFEPASNWGTEGNMSMRPDGTPDRRYWYFRRDNWNLNNLSGGGVGVAPSGFYYPSDARLKEQVCEIPAALARIGRLRGVHFAWNADGLRHLARDIEATTTVGPDATQEENEQLWQELREQRYALLGGRRIGLLAQEVEQVAPELVVSDEEGFKGVDYTRLTALLVQAVKEQQALIRGLTARITTIERGA